MHIIITLPIVPELQVVYIQKSSYVHWLKQWLWPWPRTVPCKLHLIAYLLNNTMQSMSIRNYLDRHGAFKSTSQVRQQEQEQHRLGRQHPGRLVYLSIFWVSFRVHQSETGWLQVRLFYPLVRLGLSSASHTAHQSLKEHLVFVQGRRLCPRPSISWSTASTRPALTT